MEDMKERSTESIVDHGTLCSHIDDITVSKFKPFMISSNVTGVHTRSKEDTSDEDEGLERLLKKGKICLEHFSIV